jgi:hypothetical protein
VTQLCAKVRCCLVAERDQRLFSAGDESQRLNQYRYEPHAPSTSKNAIAIISVPRQSQRWSWTKLLRDGDTSQFHRHATRGYVNVNRKGQHTQKCNAASPSNHKENDCSRAQGTRRKTMGNDSECPHAPLTPTIAEDPTNLSHSSLTNSLAHTATTLLGPLLSRRKRWRAGRMGRAKRSGRRY